MEPPPTWLLILVGAIALGLIALGVWLAGWRASHRQRERNRIARDGEHEAERILADHGFAIVSRQSIARWMIEVDGKAVAVSIRADLIVSRRGKQYVAEVKTGAHAPDPTLPATRRQLLEYSLVFGVDRVLLVDIQARAVRSVSFPFAAT